jgi:oligoendopeptidase F
MPWVNWSGLDEEIRIGWPAIPHLFDRPFRVSSTGSFKLGAVQIWRNAQVDQAGTIRRYRTAMPLGCTLPLSGLYEVAGTNLASDAETLAQAIAFMERTINELSDGN